MAHTFESESSEFGTNLAFWDSEALLPNLGVERIRAHVVPGAPRDLIRLYDPGILYDSHYVL